ncbi:hypothetical protein OPIT5_17555 [Opitutaceae bacterium TAV5]|nr:hypothetical protein OPIT5_17555 [Opitutaceae bacterium TAV5]
MKTHIKKLLTLAALTAMITLTTATARAATVIGNLDSWTTASGTAATINNVGSKAVGFTMGADSYLVTDIQLRLTVDASSAPTAISVELWSVNTGGKLDTALATFITSDAISAGATSNFTFTSTNAVTLSANTTYYIVPRVADGSLRWTVGNPSVLPTGAGATAIPNTLWGSLAGGTSPSSWTSTSANQNWYKITGAQVVPEPATTAVLAGAGILLFAIACRQFRHRNR